MLIPLLYDTFQHAQKLASLMLQTAKCVVAPLAVECTVTVAAQYAAIIASLVPAWSTVKITGYARYLGVLIGPAATLSLQWREAGHKCGLASA